MEGKLHRYDMGWSQADGGWMVVWARDLNEAEAKFENGDYEIVFERESKESQHDHEIAKMNKYLMYGEY